MRTISIPDFVFNDKGVTGSVFDRVLAVSARVFAGIDRGVDFAGIDRGVFADIDIDRGVVFADIDIDSLFNITHFKVYFRINPPCNFP
jgi:hypothetical protein